jgi:cytochrome c
MIFLVVLVARAVSVAQESNQSAKLGAYTATQAERGYEEYRKSCASCHKDDMSGSTEAPPLMGEKFMTAWQDSSVGDLVDLVRNTMPYDQPNSLRPQAYVDIVAAMLQRNNYRAGPDELPVDAERLKNLTLK